MDAISVLLKGKLHWRRSWSVEQGSQWRGRTWDIFFPPFSPGHYLFTECLGLAGTWEKSLLPSLHQGSAFPWEEEVPKVQLLWGGSLSSRRNWRKKETEESPWWSIWLLEYGWKENTKLIPRLYNCTLYNSATVSVEIHSQVDWRKEWGRIQTGNIYVFDMPLSIQILGSRECLSWICKCGACWW